MQPTRYSALDPLGASRARGCALTPLDTRGQHPSPEPSTLRISFSRSAAEGEPSNNTTQVKSDDASCELSVAGFLACTAHARFQPLAESDPSTQLSERAAHRATIPSRSPIQQQPRSLIFSRMCPRFSQPLLRSSSSLPCLLAAPLTPRSSPTPRSKRRHKTAWPQLQQPRSQQCRPLVSKQVNQGNDPDWSCALQPTHSRPSLSSSLPFACRCLLSVRPVQLLAFRRVLACAHCTRLQGHFI